MFKINVDLNKHSFKEIKDFLTAGHLIDNCVHTCMSQQIDEKELDGLKARIENSFFVKNNNKINWFVFYLSIATALVISYFMGVSTEALPLFACILFVLCYLAALIIFGGIKAIFQETYAIDILSLLKPLSDRPSLCTYCLQYCEKSESAENYRNFVLSSSRQFRQFDYTRLTLLHEYDQQSAKKLADEEQCKALHGIN